MADTLLKRFANTREQTLKLAQPLSEADMTIQAADFASPGKWHLAHTTWFFEEFLLNSLDIGWQPSADYRYLFNSYYETIGQRQAQGKRGLITRPTLVEILEYRNKVDAAVCEVLSQGITDAQAQIIELGIHHEQQHQELFLTDILFNLAQNPLFPAYHDYAPPLSEGKTISSRMVSFEGGLIEIGHDGKGFGFDNEFPRHKVYLQPFKLASHLVSNAEWIAFMHDDGYRNPLLWLSDGWKAVQSENWQMPLYWHDEDGYQSMTLSGLQAVDLRAPVTHISYFEADAYARWSGKRLPTEAEWEHAASTQALVGHFADSGRYIPDADHSQGPLHQIYGDVWEWTASPYTAYPSFKTGAGAVGEYNGKFMNGQYVLRGGSCVSPAGHLRPSYRNFFYPHQRWQFSGLRLAE